MKLEGKVAIVSGGGGGGNGEAIVQCLAEEGADVAVVDIDADAGRKSADKVKALGRKSLAIEADVTDSKQIARLVQETIDTFGKIDILVNVVGGGKGRRARTSLRFIDQTEEEWDGAFEINLKTAVLMCLAVVPHFLKQKSGKIVNLASGAGVYPAPHNMAYGAVKAGVIHFTKSLAMELAEHNINVNCVVPGLIHSPIVERGAARMIQLRPEAKGMSVEEYFEKFRRARIPMKREPVPEDIGRAALFLISEDAKNITGFSLYVSGGMFM